MDKNKRVGIMFILLAVGFLVVACKLLALGIWLSLMVACAAVPLAVVGWRIIRDAKREVRNG